MPYYIYGTVATGRIAYSTIGGRLMVYESWVIQIILVIIIAGLIYKLKL
ncbi:MAG: hypothetical protein K2N67_02740 [Mucispirillum sp.]|nr:hypothetical protein [Mucispirillum sp.]